MRSFIYTLEDRYFHTHLKSVCKHRALTHRSEVTALIAANVKCTISNRSSISLGAPMMGTSLTQPNAKTISMHVSCPPDSEMPLDTKSLSFEIQFPNHVVASGLNFKHPGFLRLMDAVCTGGVAVVVVAHKDCL